MPKYNQRISLSIPKYFHFLSEPARIYQLLRFKDLMFLHAGYRALALHAALMDRSRSKANIEHVPASSKLALDSVKEDKISLTEQRLSSQVLSWLQRDLKTGPRFRHNLRRTIGSSSQSVWFQGC